ncbi:MAG: hypothetical protein BroJett024_15710 [Alphaproteobacteria bacterium]|nr:MAG: hypothetical protein BroJett024_15710 [Alphaproteobacteria bacterium]
MAMHARLVAAIADIHLQGIEAAAGKGGKRDIVEQRPRVMHGGKLARVRRFGQSLIRRTAQIRVSDL